jgi:hypothetical protein
MTTFLSKPQSGRLIKLSGKISGYKCVRASASFVYTKTDQQKLGVVAIAAALSGMGGQAASVAGYASNVEEPAEYLEFDLDGEPVKGWVWRSPFKEGDVVDVAAEWQGDHYETYGIARPADKMIALYPHCSRTKARHVKNALKWWVIWNALFYTPLIILFLYMGGPNMLYEPAILWLSGVTASIWILMFISLSRQYMPFVRLSEKVFEILGLPNAPNLDLVESSKEKRTAKDSPEFGTFYFRY